MLTTYVHSSYERALDLSVGDPDSDEVEGMLLRVCLQVYSGVEAGPDIAGPSSPGPGCSIPPC